MDCASHNEGKRIQYWKHSAVEEVETLASLWDLSWSCKKSGVLLTVLRNMTRYELGLLDVEHREVMLLNRQDQVFLNMGIELAELDEMKYRIYCSAVVVAPETGSW